MRYITSTHARFFQVNGATFEGVSGASLLAALNQNASKIGLDLAAMAAVAALLHAAAASLAAWRHGGSGAVPAAAVAARKEDVADGDELAPHALVCGGSAAAV